MSETVSGVLGDAGAPISLPVGDKTYYLSRFTMRRQAEIEEWLSERARREVFRYRDQLSEEAYAALLYRVGKDIAAGVYKFGGAEYRKVLTTWEGMCKVLHILLKPKHPEITWEEVQDLLENYAPEVDTALALVVGDFKNRMKVGKANPDGQAA